MLINNAIDYIPTAYKNIKNKVGNKKVKAMLDTGIDDYVVNKGLTWLVNDLTKKMLQCISNCEIEKVFKEIHNEDLNKKNLNLWCLKKWCLEKISIHNFQYEQKQRKQDALVEYFEHFFKKWNFVWFVWNNWHEEIHSAGR